MSNFFNISNESVINSYTNSDQYQPATARWGGSPNGRVTVWASNGQDGSGFGIYGQRLDENGNKVGAEFRVNSTTANAQETPAVTEMADGGFMVFWTGLRTATTTTWRTYGQRYDANGNKVGAEIALSVPGDSAVRSYPSATLLSDGKVAVAYGYTAGSASDIFVQLYDSSGAAVGGRRSVALPKVNAAAITDIPAITALNGGGFVVAWGEDYGTNGYEVKAQRFDNAGSKQGGSFYVQSAVRALDQRVPNMAGLEDGGFVAVWADQAAERDGDFYTVRLQRFDAGGTKVGGEVRVNSYTYNHQTSPDVIGLKDGGYLVIWPSMGQDGDQYGIYGQRYRADGTAAGNEFRLSQTSVGSQTQVDLSLSADGDVIATWGSTGGEDGSGYAVISRTLSISNDAPVIDGREIHVAQGGQSFAAALLLPGHPQGLTAATHLQVLDRYEFIDNSSDPGSGYFVLNGAVQAAGTVINIAAADLNKLKFVGGSAAGTDNISVRAFDGTNWSAWENATAVTEARAAAFVRGDEVPVNTYTSSNQEQPTLAVMADGGFVITWMSNGQDGSQYGIYAQRFNAAGQKIGDEFKVNSLTAATQLYPVAAALPDGGFTILWVTTTGAGTANYGVHGQRYDASGVAVGGEYTVFDTSAVSTYYTMPRVTVLQDGTIKVAYAYNPNSAAASDIRVYTVDSDLARPGTTVAGVSTPKYTSGAAQMAGDIITLTNGRYVLTWAEYDSASANAHEVRGRVYNADGTAVSAPFLVNTSVAYTQRNSDIAATPDGGFVVVFGSAGAEPSGDGDANILIQRFDENGTKVGAAVRVNSFAWGNQEYPQIVALTGGGYMVSWMSENQDGAAGGIFAQRLDANLRPLGPEFQVNNDGAGDQNRVEMAALPNGGVVFTWSATNVDGSGYGIVSKVYNPSNAAPVIDARDILLGVGKEWSAGALVHHVQPQGAGHMPAALTQYEFIDTNATAGSGHFELNGIVQAANSTISVSAADLHTLKFVAGTGDTVDAISVRASDGVRWSAWDNAQARTVVSSAGTLLAGGEVGINEYTTSTQYDPSVAFLADGGYVITWASDGQDGSGYGIYARRFDKDGHGIGGEFQVNTLTAWRQDAPIVTALPDGGYVIVWENTKAADNTGIGAYAQRFDALNQKVGPQLVIFDTGSTSVYRTTPQALVLEDGRVVFTYGWHDGASVNSRIDIRLADADLNWLTSTIQVANVSAAAGNAVSKAGDITLLDNGNFVVTWMQYTASSTSWLTRARVYDSNGNPVTAQLNVGPSSDLGIPAQSSAVALAGGGFAVFTDKVLDEYTGTYRAVLMHRFAADGTEIGPSGGLRVNSFNDDSQFVPDAVSLPDGGMLVAWVSQNQDGSGYGVYAQRYDANGGLVGDEFRLSETVLGDQQQVRLAVRPDGAILATWASDGQDGSGLGIITRLFYPSDTGPILEARDILQASTIRTVPLAGMVWEGHPQGQTNAGHLQVIQKYEFIDTTPGGGYLGLNGVVKAEGQVFTVDGNNLDGLFISTPTVNSTDIIMFRGFDGVRWSDWDAARVTNFVASSSMTPGNEVVVNDYATGNQYRPAVAVLAGGGHVVTWVSEGQDGSDMGVYAQRFDAAGNKVGGEFLVNSLKTAGAQDNPDITATPDGGFVITWNSSASAASGPWAGYGQRYDGNGNPAGTQFIHAEGGNGSVVRIYPKVAVLTNGTLIIAKTIQEDTAASNGVAVSLFDDQGNPMIGPNTFVHQWLSDPKLTANGLTVMLGEVLPLYHGASTFVVTWAEQSATAGNGYEIRGRVMLPDGSPYTAPFLIHTARTGDQQASSIAPLYDTGGGFLVAWAEPNGTGSDIRYQRFTMEGTKLGPEITANSVLAGDQTQPRIVTLADGSYLITWISAGQDGSGNGIYARRFAGDDTPWGPEFLLAQTTDGHQTHPDIAVRPDGGIVAVWASENVDGSGYGVVTRLYKGDGISFPVINNFSGAAGHDSLTGTASDDRITGHDGNDTLMGGTGNDILSGRAGNDSLVGGSGDDVMLGGAGDDVYVVDETGDQVTEFDGNGRDRVETSLSAYGLGAFIEDLTYTGTGSFTGTGNDLANSITGGAGSDTLDGGAGVDTLAGGLGDDTYIIADAGETVTEVAGAGSDRVLTSLNSLTLAGNVEELIFTGTGNFSGTGNALANSITGGTGNDSLNGGAGADTLTGGTGNDVYTVDNAGDVVVELAGEGTADRVQSSISYVLGAGVENLTLTGGAAIDGTGNDAANQITGNGAANSLTGGLGNDSLNGGAGADTLVGGDGNDLYTVDNAGDQVVEAAGEGTDTVQASVSHALADEVENLTLTGSAAIDGTGNGLANVLTGNGGTNRLDGGAGADTLSGGNGDDTYIVDDAGDIVTEAAGQGTDGVETALSAYSLSLNVERLTYTGAGNFSGTGNAAANSITGGLGADTLAGMDGDDTLDGGTGADTLTGGIGDDLYIVDDAGDQVVEAAGEGTDTITTSLGSLTLADHVEVLTFTGTGGFAGTGNGLANAITGGAGNDTLGGGAGADTLMGGAGADTYAVDDGDVVTDFAAIDGDRLDLTGLDADGTLAGMQAFTWIDSAAFSNVAGELRWELVGSDVNLLADLDGDGDADMTVMLNGVASITGADLIL